MLIKTITMETEDNQLFSKTSPLLPAAAELAFHTVNCSALNAEELRRDNGIEVLNVLKSCEISGSLREIKNVLHVVMCKYAGACGEAVVCE